LDAAIRTPGLNAGDDGFVHRIAPMLTVDGEPKRGTPGFDADVWRFQGCHGVLQPLSFIYIAMAYIYP
jgi:hypothetical protein